MKFEMGKIYIHKDTHNEYVFCRKSIGVNPPYNIFSTWGNYAYLSSDYDNFILKEEPKMKLEIGKTYINMANENYTIKAKMIDDDYPFIGVWDRNPEVIYKYNEQGYLSTWPKEERYKLKEIKVKPVEVTVWGIGYTSKFNSRWLHLDKTFLSLYLAESYVKSQMLDYKTHIFSYVKEGLTNE